MKVPASLTLEYDLLMRIRNECKEHDIKFNAYVHAAIEAFGTPAEWRKRMMDEYAESKRKTTASLPHQAD